MRLLSSLPTYGCPAYHDQAVPVARRLNTMAGDCGSTCPVNGGFYSYDPNVGGNAVLLAIFAALVPVVFFMSFRFRTPSFSALLVTGLLLEVAGFVGRVLLHGHRDNQAYFVLSLFGTVLGPSFMSAAIFIVLPHILNIYGEHLCPFRPIFAGLILYGITTVATVVQVVGIVFLAYGYNGMTASLLTHDKLRRALMAN